MAHPPDQVVEHALTQGAVGNLDLLDTEFGERRRHDGDTARDDSYAVRPQAWQVQLVELACLDEQPAQLT